MKGKITCIWRVVIALVLVLGLSLVMAAPAAAAEGGVFVTPTSGLVTTEAGGTATFIIVLTSAPTDNVTIGLSSSDTTEGTVAPASVTFASTNWSAPQTVTVTGVDDAVDDGNIAYSIITAAATSTDPNYSGVDAADVSVTNTDDDTAGISVTPTVGLVTTEAAGTATFTIVLTSAPTDNVTIGLSSSDLTEGTVSPASVIFTSANWSAAQTVTVTGVDDAVADGNIAYNIITAAATSGDTKYNTLNAADVSVTNNDNEPGIIVTPTSGLVTTEAAGKATFTIVLNTAPTADVTIDLSSSDLTEGTVSPASVIFTSGDWSTAQTVTVTGVDDAVDDGDVAYTIITAAATSTDPKYSGKDADNVSVTNTNDDVAGISVAPTSGLVTTEAAGKATFTIVLTSEPTASVTIGLSSSDLTEGTVSPASVIFTSANWSAAQTVTVTGVDDAVADGNIAYNIITAAATSGDTKYNTLNAADVSVTNNDNDAGVFVTPTSGLVTTEADGEPGPNTFTIVLNTAPSANVTIDLSSSDLTEGTVSPASVIFTSANWSTAQTVTVTGVNDDVADGNVAYTIITAAAVSDDTNYDGVDATDVSVTNTDDDTAGITVAPTSGLVTTEDAVQDTFTIVLTSEPTANVIIGLSSSDTTEGTVAPASVIFASTNWSAAQTVTVTGVDDYVLDGDIAYNIITAAATSTDPKYSGKDADNVSVTNNDNEEWGTITIILTAIEKIEAKLDSEVFGLAAIKIAIDAIDFSGLEDKIDAIAAKVDTLPTLDSDTGSPTLAAGASVTIVPSGATPLLGTLSIQSNGTGYDVDVYTGTGWITIVESGARNASYPVSGFGLRIVNDTTYSRTVTFVVVYQQGP
jgi:hypothetical protein